MVPRQFFTVKWCDEYRYVECRYAECCGAYQINRATRRLVKKIAKFFKNSPKSCQVKKGQNIYNKAQFENPKHLQQTMPWNCLFRQKKLIILLKQKVAIFWGYFVLSKNHNEPPKVARLAKNLPIWSPCR
jgi:hypothetical protein